MAGHRAGGGRAGAGEPAGAAPAGRGGGAGRPADPPPGRAAAHRCGAAGGRRHPPPPAGRLDPAMRSRPGSGQACPVGAARLHPRCPPGAGRPRQRAGQGHLGPGDLRPPRRPVVHQDHAAVAGRRRQAVGGRAAAPPPRQRRLPGPGEDQQCGAAVAAPARQARSRVRPGRAGPRRRGELPQPDRLPGGNWPDQPLPPEHDLPGRAGGTGRDPRPGPGPGRPGRGRAGR